MAGSRNLTLLDLIQAVSEVAANDQEIMATVADLINSGQVRLCGDTAGAIIDLLATADAAAWGLAEQRTIK
jgi:hypothetical protein